MTTSNARIAQVRPSGITFLAVVNYVACGVTLIFWALVYFGRLVPAPGSLQSEPERANAAVTYGFMLGDVICSAPLLVLAGSGLWRLRTWGWLAAQMANALWIYSMTIVLMRDFYSRWSPGGLLFVPFAAIALWAVPAAGSVAPGLDRGYEGRAGEAGRIPVPTRGLPWRLTRRAADPPSRSRSCRLPACPEPDIVTGQSLEAALSAPR